MKNSRTPRLSDLIRRPPSPGSAESPSHPRRVEGAGSEEETPSSETPAAVAGTEAEPQSLRPGLKIQPTEPEAEAHRDYELFEKWLASVFSQARQGVLECSELFDDVRILLERPKLLDALFAETFKTRTPGDFFARKSLNVGIYALHLGRALRYKGEPLVTIGVAALLHKIGFASLAEDLVTKRGALNRREFASVREHPQLGAKMIAALGRPFEDAAKIVASANERIDGSGYPSGLKGTEIRTESLIIGLVDVFEALIQPRPYRERTVPFGAVKEILEREKARFPRELLREFISSFSVFPPFTYVRLNSRAVARVIEAEAGYPLRPRVEIVVDAGGQKPSIPQVLRLRESPLLYITGPVSEEELPA